MNRKISNSLIAIALILIFSGVGTLFYLYKNDQKEISKADRQTEKIENVIENQNNTDDNARTTEPDVIPDNCVGIMYIPSFDLKHAIHMGVDNNVLNKYIGMYESHGTIGEPGNAVFASHSNTFGPGKKNRCWFNWIDDTVKTGDKITILWKDGKKYQYIVTDVISWIPASEEEKYLDYQPEGNKEMITLQTCTHGNSTYRSFIQAEREETDE